ncbi:glycosyltransferase [Paenibacillus sp. JJ1722]|uniref:glycosyltransferase n=2 Tax=unclassified Paenibacillus TaxID=185978 RepID=UPI003AB08450
MMNSIYNGYFFNDFYAENGGGNYTDRERWQPFFARIADEIVRRFDPKTVLDAGCAMGYLVEALRKRGVEAYGFDISQYAISNVHDDIKPYCIVHSIEEPLPSSFPQKFDLVVTLEVLEHLSPDLGEKAIENLCEYTDMIIFSSTPDDIEDRTHVNVQLGEYWSKKFAENGFFRNLVQPMDFICSWAMIFERKKNSIPDLIFNYEMNMRINEIQYDEKNKSLTSKVFFDTGKGFNEEESVELIGSLVHNEIRQKIVLPQNTRAVRFDPVENKACILKDINVISSEGVLEFHPINGVIVEDYVVFDNFDPQINVILLKDSTKWIEVKAAILVYEEIENFTLLSKLKEIPLIKKELLNKERLLNEISIRSAEELKETVLQKDKELKETLLQKDKELKEVSEAKDEKISGLTEKNEKFEKKYNDYHQLISSQIDDLNNELLQVRSAYDNVQAAYNSINTAFFWKMTKPLRLVLDLFKKKTKKLTETDTRNAIELFEFENNILTIKGWVFSENDKIDDMFLKIIHGKKEYRLELISGLERKDVEEVYNIERARYSGFNSNVSIDNFSSFKVYLEFTLDGTKKHIFIGKVQSNIFEYLSFIKKRLNKQNVHKLLNYLRSGRFDLIISAIKRPRISAVTSTNVPSINLPDWLENNTVNSLDFSAEIYQHTIDLIVPVYNGFTYFDTLFQTIKKTQMKYRLIIINDDSTDIRVSEYLSILADQDPRIIFIENLTNLGFVKTVNKGLSLTENHVVLLNTDIELPEFWLERLMTPIILGDKIATTTPFTNSGTLCSFPLIGKDNGLFENMDCDDIDKEFRLIKPVYHTLPTGVGFCMGINKNALGDIGNLDAETFSKGYGEENDWCQRAIKNGYRNVIVDNLFVYHKHGGSFPSEEKQRLIEENAKLLSKKHPNYNADVAAFFELDPLRSTRDFLIMKLSATLDNKKPLVFLDHNIGGGASAYLENLKKEKNNNDEKIIVIKYDVDSNFFLMLFNYKQINISYRFSKFSELEQILDAIGVEAIYINELVTYPDLYQTLEQISTFKRRFGSKLIMLLHDYFSICPTVNLLDVRGCFCDIPESSKCERCALSNPYNNYLQYETMSKWRIAWGSILQDCDEIIAFSNSSAELLQRTYGDLNSLSIIPHQVKYMPKISKSSRTSTTLNIGLIGVLNFHKGIDIVRKMLNLIEVQGLDVRITLIGSSEGEIQHSKFTETGKYYPESLPRLVLQNKIDLFFISSIWPETFSYTSEEVMKMGLPIAVFDLGAPAERAKRYEKGLVISEVNAQVALDEILEFSDKVVPLMQDSLEQKRVLFVAEYLSFSSRYRVEHFIEQLIIQGVESDFIETKDIDLYDIKSYNAIVLYRCTLTPTLSKMIKDAKNSSIKVFYDIDDYIFSFENIKDLEFLSGDDYSDFENYSKKIFNCMNMCDGFFTSTNNMAKAIEESFQDKPVFINRNVASMEMVAISAKAKNIKMKNKNEISIGYFSGSKTHDGDFEVISEVVINVLEKYDNVFLRIGGCLQLNQRFEKYKDRITHFDFVDWRKLPELVASVDINLMPLEDTFFHACKSENKWMEAALVNVPTVASRNSELKLIIENEVTGYLCSDEREWQEALTSLIESEKLRFLVGRNANEKVLSDHVTLNTGNNAVEELFEGVRVQ